LPLIFLQNRPVLSSIKETGRFEGKLKFT